MPSQTWDLRGWIVLAIGVSVILHFFLISFLKGYTFTWIGKVDEFSTEFPFKVDSIVIDKALLAPDYDQSGAQPEFEDNVTTEADILEIAEAVADKELALTPADARLHYEPPGMHGSQGPNVFCHQQRFPQWQ